MEKYLTFEDEKSKKFWHIRTEENKTIVTFGRIGTAGQAQEKAFPSPEAAEKEAASQTAAKLKKGYTESTAPTKAATLTAKESAPKAAKKTAHRAENGPADVSDDGELKPWHGEDYFEYSWSYSGEKAFSHLEETRDEPWDEDETDKPAKKASSAGFSDVTDDEIEFDEDDDEDDRAEKRMKAHLAKNTPEQLLEEWRVSAVAYHRNRDTMTDLERDSHVRKWLCGVISDKVTWKHRYQDCEKHIEALRLLVTDDGDYRSSITEALSDGVEEVIGDTYVDDKDVERLAWLLQRGAALSGTPKLAVCKEFMEAYTKNPDPAKVKELFNKAAENVVAALAPKYAKDFGDMVRGFLAGEVAGGEWPEGATHFVISKDGIAPNTSRGKKWKSCNDNNSGVNVEWFSRELEKSLPELLQKMAEAGEFDALANVPLSVIAAKGTYGQTYLCHTLSKTALEQQQAYLNALIEGVETVTDFDDAIGADMAVSALLDGIYFPVDMPRARAILQKFLYSLSTDSQEQANSLYDKYDNFFPELEYDRALWLQQNGHFKPALNVMRWAANKGCAPAAEKLAEFKAAEIRRNEILAKYQAGGTSKNDTRIGKDNFRKIFSESDLLLNTKNVLARAYIGGEIYIRFKIEGEEGYSETLDWLINLLEKGYADLNDGYSIIVRFLIKPVFIKAIASAASREDGIGFSKNTCHAFFARAVEYPALREKVKRYAENALRLYDWYRDIEDEDNCVTGTFAACALAFAEEKYVPLIGLFGRNSDDEHQYVQLLVAGPLFKQYGATPEVAAALFDIQSSNGQEGYINLNKALLTTPACLAGVMEHIQRGELGKWAPHHLEYHVPGYVEAIWGSDVKSNLKKFKQFADGAASSQDKNVFIDFYNFYKKYAALRDKADYGENLESAAESKKNIAVPAYDTDPLLSVLEAHKADWFWTDSIDDTRGMFFFPVCIDDPELLDYVFEQWNAGNTAAKAGVLETFHWGEGRTALGKWVFNTERLAKGWGMVLTDGKNKPFVLYGILNVTQLSTRWCKRPFKTPEEAEAARQSAFIRESPARIPLATDEEKAFDAEFDKAFSAVWNKHWWMASQLLQKYKPEHGRYYDAAVLLRAIAAEHFGELDEAAALYDEMTIRRPEFAAALALKKSKLGKKKK